jgi:hypothetical protein
VNRSEAHAVFDRLLDLVEQWQHLADDEDWDVDRSADTEEQIYNLAWDMLATVAGTPIQRALERHAVKISADENFPSAEPDVTDPFLAALRVTVRLLLDLKSLTPPQFEEEIKVIASDLYRAGLGELPLHLTSEIGRGERPFPSLVKRARDSIVELIEFKRGCSGKTLTKTVSSFPVTINAKTVERWKSEANPANIARAYQLGVKRRMNQLVDPVERQNADEYRNILGTPDYLQMRLSQAMGTLKK